MSFLRDRFEAAVADLSLLPAEEVAKPYRRLLCHAHDMTSTLANHHGGVVNLSVLDESRDDGRYYREVELSVTGKVVEYGLIEVWLENFPEEVSERILAGKEPLGAILNESGLVYQSEPEGFFKAVDSNFAFGRYNRLLDSKRRILARIIEILPCEKS